MNVIGVMSGTSMDGIDVAMLATDGDTNIVRGPSSMSAYPASLRTQLIALIADQPRASAGDLTMITDAVTDAHCMVVEAFLAEQRISPQRIDLVGFHGQTVFHTPERRITRQLFNGPRAAARLGINVVSQFRTADVLSGGQGAPLAPLYHRALVEASLLPLPLVVLNLGGVANVTFLGREEVSAFDTGPASALLDDFVRIRRGEAYDRDGALAERGHVDTALLERFLAHDYFKKSPPKSLDRNAFHEWMAWVAPLDDADGAATLTAFTIESIAAAARHFSSLPTRWLVGGGGRHNAYLMQRLRNRLGVPVDPVEAVGWNGDTLEAECFGWLAVRSLKGLPLSLPSTTGVPYPMTGGEMSRVSLEGRE
jgi:anhydro-N-acetylmuramic acid kinase